MGLYQRGTVYWVRVQIDGREIRKSTGKTVKREAEQWERDFVSDLRGKKSAAELAETVRRIRMGSAEVTIDNAMTHFLRLNVPRRGSLSDRSRQQIESIWRDWSAWLAAKHPAVDVLADVSPEMARGYAQQLAKYGRFVRTIKLNRPGRRHEAEYENSTAALGQKSRREYLIQLRHVFRVCRRSAGLTENPFEDVPIPAASGAHRDVFSESELKTIINHADDFTRPLIIIGANTGLRLGDVCTLTWAEIDTDGGWIRRLAQRKTGQSVLVPMLPEVRSLIAGLPPSETYLLPTQADMYLSNRSGVSYRLRNTFAAAKIPARAITGSPLAIKDFHSLRHTFVWRAARLGVPLPIVQAVVGHGSASLTRLYSDHAKEVDLKHLAAILSSNR